MPKVIKKNFIYRAVWNNLHNNMSGCVFLFIGNVGFGKSTAAIRWLSDLDSTFDVSRIVFSVKEAISLTQTLKPGSAVLFDEIAGSEEGADSRNSLSDPNKILSYFVSTSRSRRLIIIYCCPRLDQIDKRVRSIGVTGGCNFKRKVDRNWGVSRPDFYWSWLFAKSGMTIEPKPRLHQGGWMIDRIGIGLPKDRELLFDYNKKKRQFQIDSSERWKKKFEAKEKKVNLRKTFDVVAICNEIDKHPEFYLDDKGVVSGAALKIKYPSLGEPTIKRVKEARKLNLIERYNAFNLPYKVRRFGTST